MSPSQIEYLIKQLKDTKKNYNGLKIEMAIIQHLKLRGISGLEIPEEIRKKIEEGLKE